jgi:hypothetical protein
MEMQAYEEVEDEPELPNQVRMTQNRRRKRARKGNIDV